MGSYGMLVKIFLLFISLCSPLIAGVNILGKVVWGDNQKGIADAVVWVEIENHQPRRKPKIEKMVQKGKEFHPRVLVAPVNTEVFFPNEDPIFHNIFSFNKVKKLDLGNYKGEGKPVIFEAPGVYPIGCSIHPWMSAYILIVSSPFFAKSSSSGSFVLKDLKEGTYTLNLWSADLLENQRKELVLKDGMNQLEWTLPEDLFKRKKKKRKKRKKRKKKSYDGY